MAYRFTNTDKWQRDAWFIDLKPMEKLLFLYLCENCDIAGFVEYSSRKIAFDINTDIKTIEGALKGLERALLRSKDGMVLYLKNFIRHQKNLPLNENNKMHSGIISRLKENVEKFGYQYYNDFLISKDISPCQGAKEGFESPTGNILGNILGNKEGGLGETKVEKPTKQTVDDFYRDQIKLSDNDQTYKKTVEFLLGLLPDSSRCDNILGLKEQLTFEQFKKVKDVVARSGTSISELLIGMENKKDLQKKYKSVNLTMQGWARLEGKRSNNFKQKADAQRY